MKLSEEPSEVIKKNRIADFNIRSSSTKRVPGWISLFASDMRLSCSQEQKTQLPTSNKVFIEQERVKERHSFQLGWVRLDMTVTQTRQLGRAKKGQATAGELSYEVELEIADV